MSPISAAAADIPFSVAVMQALDDETASCAFHTPPGFQLGPGYRVRRAVVSDIPAVMELIRGLARFEGAEDAVTMTEEVLKRDAFGREPLLYVLLTEHARGGDGDESQVHDADDRYEPVGFAALCFMYSTWAGRTLYLEDLFVDAQHRSKGIAKHVFLVLSRVAQRLDCGRFQWAVLDWNERAQRLYTSLGSTMLHEWRLMRMERHDIARLVARGDVADEGGGAAAETDTG